MRLTLRTTIVAGVLAIGGLLAATSLAHAGGCCGGGGGFRGFASRASYRAPRAPAGSSCCQMGGMAMGGMSMATSPATQDGMAGMNMAAPAPAATAGSPYYCPMHPTVVSAAPATCPYCQMALKKR